MWLYVRMFTYKFYVVPISSNVRVAFQSSNDMDLCMIFNSVKKISLTHSIENDMAVFDNDDINTVCSIFYT